MKMIEIPTSESLELIWAIREKVNEETAKMSREEFATYIRKGCEHAQDEIEKRRAARLTPSDKTKS